MGKKKQHKAGEQPPKKYTWAPHPKPRLGEQMSFIPEAFFGETKGTLPGREELPRRVTGQVTYINETHHWFRVEYEVNGYRLSECFKF